MDKKVKAELDKSKGVEVHGSKVRITFHYKGRRFREALKGLEVTVANIRFAKRKRDNILYEIETKSFDYGEHFPESKNAQIHVVSKSSNRTISDSIESWLQVKAGKCAPSTFTNYESKSMWVARWAGDRRIVDITQSELELFQVNLVKGKVLNKEGKPEKLEPKTVNDIFIIVRGIWRAAYVDGIIDRNPADRVNNFVIDNNETEADPFTREEMDRILNKRTHRIQEINLVGFRMWAGVSSSEAFGLCWEDYDKEGGTIAVERSVVAGEYKMPKEKSRRRVVELLDPAIEWLEKQREETFMHPQKMIQIRKWDNLTFKDEMKTPIFLNSKTGEIWSNSNAFNRSFFTHHLKLAKVRHRGVNQCRHTFASQCLTGGLPETWICTQMGHTSPEMLRKHYAKYIPDDAPKLAGLFSDMLGVASKKNKGKFTFK